MPRLFADYVDCREKVQLQKLHYLSEFLRLREILNFFQKKISMQFTWNRPHRPAKSAIFWMKPNFFLKKLENVPNSSQIMLAGNGRCIKSWPEICWASPKGTSTYSECTKVCFTCLFMKKTSLTNFFQKNCSKIEKKFIFFQK